MGQATADMGLLRAIDLPRANFERAPILLPVSIHGLILGWSPSAEVFQFIRAGENIVPDLRVVDPHHKTPYRLQCDACFVQRDFGMPGIDSGGLQQCKCQYGNRSAEDLPGLSGPARGANLRGWRSASCLLPFIAVLTY
jgi:hypothetical protein